MKRLLAALLAICMLAGCAFAEGGESQPPIQPPAFHKGAVLEILDVDRVDASQLPIVHIPPCVPHRRHEPVGEADHGRKPSLFRRVP